MSTKTMTPKKLNANDLKIIRIVLESSYTPEELNACSNFDEFWALVDTQNGYEYEWTPYARARWKPYYEEIFNEIKKKLKE